MRIGVISDTHGLMRPEALSALAGADLILNAGDAGSPGVLDDLGRIARVAAVRGNVDVEDWAARLPESVSVEAAGKRVLVVHDIGRLKAHAAARHHAIVFGHSHRPLVEWRGEVLYLNPGSAGPRRFRLPVTLAIIETGDGKWAPRIVDLLRTEAVPTARRGPPGG